MNGEGFPLPPGDKTDILAKLAEVNQDRLKEDITSDYLLAKFENEEVFSIVELARAALYFRNLILKALKLKKWTWQDNQWKEVDQSDEEKLQIINNAKKSYDIIMTAPHVLAILRRNREANHLANLLAERAEETDPITQTIQQKAKEVLRNEEQTKV